MSVPTVGIHVQICPPVQGDLPTVGDKRGVLLDECRCDLPWSGAVDANRVD